MHCNLRCTHGFNQYVMIAYAHLYQVDLEPKIKQALGHLRRFHKHATSTTEDMSEEEWEAAVLAARQELLDYAKLVETVGVILVNFKN